MENREKSQDRKEITGNNPDTICRQVHELYEQLAKILKKHIALEEKEQSAIHEGDADRLHAYRELEKTFITKEKAYGRVILTFNELYTETGKDEDGEVKRVKSEIDTLQRELMLLMNKNRETLAKKITALDSELTLLSKKGKKKTSPYKKIGRPSYVDIQV